MSRYAMWLASFMFAVGFLVSACDDDPEPSSDVGVDVVDDQVVDDTSDMVEEPDVSYCDGGTRCAGNADCAHLGDYYCAASGCCEEVTVTPNCVSQGQACESDEWSNDNFICDADLNECLARCDSTTTDSLQENSCPSGHWCFELNEADTDLDGACVRGDCNDSCFDPADCPSDTAWACDDDNGTCWALGNGASFCFEAGDATEGDACDLNSTTPADICEAGLFCFNAVCTEPCPYDDGDLTYGCTDGDECVPVLTQTGDNTAGVCGDSCGEFSEGECDTGMRCDVMIGPFTGEVTSWICIDQFYDGATPPALVPIVGYMEACDAQPDTDGYYDNQCGEGLACAINFEDDEEGVCQQMCDFTMTSDGDLANCPATASSPIMEDSGYPYTDYLDALGYLTVDALADEDLQVFSDAAPNTSLFSLTGLDLAEGTANTIFAFSNATASTELVSFTDWDGDPAGPTATYGGVRGYNVTSEALDVRIVDIVALDVADDTPTAFAPIVLGTDSTNYWVYNEDFFEFSFANDGNTSTVDSAEVIAFGDPTAAAPDTFTQVGFFSNETDVDLETEAAFRFINGYTAASTMMVTMPGIAEGEVEFGDESAAWGHNPITTSQNIIFQFEWKNGGVTSTNYTIVGAQAGEIYSVLLHDAGGTAPWEFVLLEGAELADTSLGDIDIRVTNATGDTISVGVEDDLLLGGAAVSSFDSLPATDGALDLEPGDYAFSAREAGEAYDSAPEDATSTDTISLINQDIISMAFGEFEGSLFGMGDADPVPTLDASGSGDSQLRFINFAGGSLRLETAGEAAQVCAPLTVEGLGRCMDRCAPYMPGIDYQDADGPTGRWEQNGCPSDLTPEDASLTYGCFAFVTTGDQETPHELPGPPDIEGFCFPKVAASATGDFGSVCTTTGDAGCNPDSFCVGMTETRAECTKLCLPFTGNGGSDCQDPDVCQASLVAQEYGFCFEPDLPTLHEGDACTAAQAGLNCADDDTLCISVPDSGYECRRVCKKGIEDTDGFNPSCPLLIGDDRARECRPDLAFQSPIPEYVSVCDFAP